MIPMGPLFQYFALKKLETLIHIECNSLVYDYARILYGLLYFVEKSDEKIKNIPIDNQLRNNKRNFRCPCFSQGVFTI